MNRRVVVTGMGTISPVGLNVSTAWEALIAGKSGVGRITSFDPSALKTQIAAQVKGFDPTRFMDTKEARRLDPYIHYAWAATVEALADSGLDLAHEDRERIGVIVGSAVGGIQTLLSQYDVLQQRGPRRLSPFFIPAMLVDSAGGQIAIQLGIRGPNMAVISACATGTSAVGEAAEVVGRGDADIMIAGGAEAALVMLTVGGFDVMGAMSTRNDNPEGACRPFDANRDGFLMGEGAAILIVEALDHALARGARIYGEVLGYGGSADAYHMAAPAENGEGAVVAMKLAIRKAGIEVEEIDYINAHGTATKLNDKGETTAIKAVLGAHAYRVAISSTKSMTAHLLGGAGTFEALVCLKALNEGIIPPTINYETPDPECDLDYTPNVARRLPIRVALSNSFGFGGHNASIVLRRWVQPENAAVTGTAQG